MDLSVVSIITKLVVTTRVIVDYQVVAILLVSLYLLKYILQVRKIPANILLYLIENNFSVVDYGEMFLPLCAKFNEGARHRCNKLFVKECNIELWIMCNYRLFSIN